MRLTCAFKSPWGPTGCGPCAKCQRESDRSCAAFDRGVFFGLHDARGYTPAEARARDKVKVTTTALQADARPRDHRGAATETPMANGRLAHAPTPRRGKMRPAPLQRAEPFEESSGDRATSSP
jgi:hypothetical protein